MWQSCGMTKRARIETHVRYHFIEAKPRFFHEKWKMMENEKSNMDCAHRQAGRQGEAPNTDPEFSHLIFSTSMHFYCVLLLRLLLCRLRNGSDAAWLTRTGRERECNSFGSMDFGVAAQLINVPRDALPCTVDVLCNHYPGNPAHIYAFVWGFVRSCALAYELWMGRFSCLPVHCTYTTCQSATIVAKLSNCVENYFFSFFPQKWEERRRESGEIGGEMY